MLMKNPPHPGEHVRHDYLEPLGFSITKAAARLGVTRQALNNVVNGHSGISPEMAIRLSMGLAGSPELWLHMQMQYDLAQAMRNVSDMNVERLAAAV